MICNKCAAENEDGAVFCKSCGASLSDESRTSGESFSTGQTEPVQDEYGGTPFTPAAPQHPFNAAPQQPFNAAPQPPFNAAPQQPFNAAPQRPFNAAPQQPFNAAPQQPFNAAPQPAAGATAIKRTLSSTVFLIAVIALTASLAVTLVSLFMQPTLIDIARDGIAAFYNNLGGGDIIAGLKPDERREIEKAINELKDEMGGEGEEFSFDKFDSYDFDIDELDFSFLDQISTASRISMVIGGIIGMIPSLLICAGLWMAFSSSKKQFPTSSGAGFTLVKAGVIINLIMYCFAGFGLLALWAIGGIMLAFASNAAWLLAAGIAVMVVALIVTAVFVLTLVYYTKLLKLLTGAKNTIEGREIVKVPMLVVVLNFIIAAGGVFSIFTLDFASFFNSAFLILVSVALIQYKSSCDRQFNPYQ